MKYQIHFQNLSPNIVNSRRIIKRKQMLIQIVWQKHLPDVASDCSVDNYIPEIKTNIEDIMFSVWSVKNQVLSGLESH